MFLYPLDNDDDDDNNQNLSSTYYMPATLLDGLYEMSHSILKHSR